MSSKMSSKTLSNISSRRVLISLLLAVFAIPVSSAFSPEAIETIQSISPSKVVPASRNLDVIPEAPAFVLKNLQKRAGAAPSVNVVASITGNGQSISDSKPTAVITTAGEGEDKAEKAVTTSSEPMPTLQSTGVATPSITVPPSGNNPFIQHSNLPEGTVFIAVGAILGGIGLALIAWRIVAAQALRKSIKRSEAATLLAEEAEHKTPIFSAANAGRRSGRDTMSANFSSDNVTSFGANNRHTMASGHSLFFSPTTEVMNMGKEGSNSLLGDSVGIGGLTSSGTGGGSLNSNLGVLPAPTSATRSSVYLPSGYYGVGGGAGSAGSFTSRSIRPMSMAARESSYGPGSASMDQVSERYSTADRHSVYPTVRTNVNNRAPSAYLDDLLAGDSGDSDDD